MTVAELNVAEIKTAFKNVPDDFVIRISELFNPDFWLRTVKIDHVKKIVYLDN